MNEEKNIEFDNNHPRLNFVMEELTSKMPAVILCNYFDTNKYLFNLYFEAFNSIRGVCVLLGNGALISQACPVLRMAIEKVATIHVLEQNADLVESYIEHQQFRFSIRSCDNKTKIIKEHYSDNLLHCKVNAVDFLEYVWLGENVEKYSFDELIKFSNIQSDKNELVEWKNELNQWTHGTLVFMNLAIKDNAYNPSKYMNALIDIAAYLLDILICDFHNRTKFNFKIDGIDYFKIFRDTYNVVGKKLINNEN